MTPEQLAAALHAPAARVLAARRDGFELAPGTVTLERPKNKDHGDWATNVALKLAKQVDANPRDLAGELAASFAAVDGIAAADVAGPGFINLTLATDAAGELARTIIEQGAAYGRNDALAGEVINLEFVSANPTGPLHLGHTRWAAVGDALARVMSAAGAEVAREYYINDAGAQMDKFGWSVLHAALGEPAAPDDYPGQYIQVLGARVLEEVPDLPAIAARDGGRDEAMATAREVAYRIQLDEIEASLDAFNVHFDIWFSERQLHEPDPETGLSAIDRAVDRLREQGHVYDADDAVWVRTTDFGDDKDRVIRRGNGVYTYFAADAAYYLSKRDRGFEQKYYFLGADHHGYVKRLKALAGAAGDDMDTLHVLIGQLVQLNGARLSKRAGNIVELDDLLDWIGSDALRYWLARFPADSPISIEGETLRQRTNDNPVYYVQYAHARTAAVARNAAESGVTRDVFEPATLSHETESVLLSALADYERVVRQAAELREPHRVARHLEQIAGHYHRWYDACRVIPLGDAPIEPVHNSRLWLNDAVGQVLRNGLDLLGVSAPERM